MSEILYSSTNLKAPKVSFGNALLKGLAPDGGLYMPETIPQLTSKQISGFAGMEYHQIANQILSVFLHDAIPAEKLANMTKEAYNFEVPLEKVYDKKYIMRLDADDYLDHNALLVLSNALEKDPNLGLVFPDYFLK